MRHPLNDEQFAPQVAKATSETGEGFAFMGTS
jgi:hypothetical protein